MDGDLSKSRSAKLGYTADTADKNMLDNVSKTRNRRRHVQTTISTRFSGIPSLRVTNLQLSPLQRNEGIEPLKRHGSPSRSMSAKIGSARDTWTEFVQSMLLTQFEAQAGHSFTQAPQIATPSHGRSHMCLHIVNRRLLRLNFKVLGPARTAWSRTAGGQTRAGRSHGRTKGRRQWRWA